MASTNSTWAGKTLVVAQGITSPAASNGLASLFLSFFFSFFLFSSAAVQS